MQFTNTQKFFRIALLKPRNGAGTCCCIHSVQCSLFTLPKPFRGQGPFRSSQEERICAIFGTKYSIFDKLSNLKRLCDWIFVLLQRLAGFCIITNNCPCMLPPCLTRLTCFVSPRSKLPHQVVSIMVRINIFRSRLARCSA